MKKLMRDALIFVGGFAAGVATMHFLMRDTYKKQADVLVEDARNHFKQREQELDMTIEQRSNEKAYDLVSGPYRQEEDSEKPTHEPMEAIEIIPSDEFGNEDDYETSFLTYYADGILTYDSDGSRVEDVEKVIGPKALDNFGAEEPDLVHIRTSYYGGFLMRCCPMCYCKAYLKNTGAMTCGTTMKLQYEISCSNCGLGPAKTGAVLMTYNEHSMQGVIDDSDLKQLIKDWDSILRDPEAERIANI